MKQLTQIVVNETDDEKFVVKVGHGEQVTTSDEHKHAHDAVADAVDQQDEADALYELLGWEG